MFVSFGKHLASDCLRDNIGSQYRRSTADDRSFDRCQQKPRSCLADWLSRMKQRWPHQEQRNAIGRANTRYVWEVLFLRNSVPSEKPQHFVTKKLTTPRHRSIARKEFSTCGKSYSYETQFRPEKHSIWEQQVDHTKVPKQYHPKRAQYAWKILFLRNSVPFEKT